MNIVQITGEKREVIAGEWLQRAEGVHRQLRPQMPRDYVAKMKKVFADGGEMCICVEGDRVLGIAVYRMFENTVSGVRYYVDDLITDQTQRSTGVGHMLMQYMEADARRRGANSFELESGTHREQAHKFYFREGMTIPSFSFKKALA